jgi:hypothetical protein
MEIPKAVERGAVGCAHPLMAARVRDVDANSNDGWTALCSLLQLWRFRLL